MGRMTLSRAMRESFVRGLRRQGDVDGRSRALGPPNFIAEGRILDKGPAVLVKGDTEGIGIVPVDVLCSRHDGSRYPQRRFVWGVVFSDVLDHDRLDVHVAEPGAVDHEHPHDDPEAEQLRRRYSPLWRGPCLSRDRTAGGNECDSVTTLEASGRDVKPIDVIVSCQSRFVFGDAFRIEESFFKNLILGIQQTFSRSDGGVSRPVEGWKKPDLWISSVLALRLSLS